MERQKTYVSDTPADSEREFDFENVNLSDFALFLSVMKHKEAHECVLSIILGEPSLKLTDVHVEEVVLNKNGERGIRLDAWAVSNDSRQFATEMQNDSDQDDIRKRSRFYQGLLDTPILKAGKRTKYRNLPSTIVTFITQKDIFGKDRAMYTFTERCHEFPDLELGDGTKKIFLNMASKNGRAELISLLQYMNNSTLSNPEIPVLDERIKKLDAIVSEVKQTEEWEAVRMSILSTGLEIGRKEGFKVGRSEGLEIGRSEGLEIGRSEGLEIGRSEGLEIGRSEGLEIGISSLIRMGQETHLSDEIILEQLQKNFNLDSDTAKQYLQKYAR